MKINQKIFGDTFLNTTFAVLIYKKNDLVFKKSISLYKKIGLIFKKSNQTKNMNTLHETFLTHPKKQEILKRITNTFDLSENSTRRKIRDGSILGKPGVINLLYAEFAIKIKTDGGTELDYEKFNGLKKKVVICPKKELSKKNVWANAEIKKINDLHGYTLYSWKHTGVCKAFVSGLNIKYLQQILRHSSIAITDIYLKSLSLNNSTEILKGW